MEISEALEHKFNKAKIGLMNKKDSVFLTTVLFSLKHVWTDKVEYSGTDGEHIFMNPEYMETLDHEQFMSTLAHNAWRTALKHPVRQGIRDEKRFQEAGAHVTNNLLLQQGYNLPETELADTQYAEKCTEEVYTLLQQNPPKGGGGGGNGGGAGNSGQGQGSGSGSGDPFGNNVLQPGEGDPNGDGQAQPQTMSQAKAREADIDDMLMRAATQAEMKGQAGSVPGDIKRELHEMLNPKLDWRTLLQNYMEAYAKDDFSWQKPNRRFFPDFYLPSAYSEAVGEIAIAVDTSGSVSQAEFQAFITEINSIKQNLDPEITTVIDFDTRVNNVTKLSRDEDVSAVSFSGGGGTCLQPVFDHYDKEKPVVLIVFSDLYCAPIEKDPGYPVLWVVVNNEGAHVNFGTTIDYDTTDL